MKEFQSLFFNPVNPVNPASSCLAGGGLRRQTVFEVRGGERFDHFDDVAFDEAVEVVEGEADAVVGDAVLGVVVGANFFFASAAAEEGFAVGGIFFFLGAAFVFEEAGAHDLQGAGFVLNLRASVLAADDASGGDVHDLDGGVGGVDALAAGAAGAADFDAEVAHGEDEVDFFGFGEDGDGGDGGVDAALGLGGGDALDAVRAGFVAHAAEDGFAGEPEDNFLQPAEIGVGAVHDLDLEAGDFGVAGVHAVEVGGEERGLRSSGAGADFHDGVLVFVGLGGEERDAEVEFELGDLFFEFGDLGAGKLGHFGVTGGGEFAVFG